MKKRYFLIFLLILGYNSQAQSTVDKPVNSNTYSDGAKGINKAGNYVPEICIVLYCQTNNGYCVIWEKPTVNYIESFNVYGQDTGSSQQVLLGTVDYDSLSVYTDVSFPNYTGVRKYWLSANLVGGSETSVSQRHEPIILKSQIVGTDVNIFWNEYFPYQSPSWEYDIYKGSSPTNLQLVQANWWITTGYVFPIPATPEYYAVKVSNYSANCNPTRANYDIWSNVVTSNIIVGADKKGSLLTFSISPNPSNGKFNIEYTASGNSMFSVRCVNIQGQNILEQTLAGKRNEIDLGSVAKGLYMLQVFEEGALVKNERIVVN